MTDIWKVFASNEGPANRARNVRRGYPIHMYVGKNGGGKSAMMVWDTLPDLKSGRPVLSTVRLLDFENPRLCDDLACDCEKTDEKRHAAAHPGYIPFRRWKQLVEFRDGVVLMDEITGVADSNEGSSMPAPVANKLAQLRRVDVTVRLTGLSFVRASKRIREAVVAVTRCQSMFPITAVADDGTERVWRQRRLCLSRTYDAQSLPVDDITEAAFEKADLLAKSRLWLPDSPAIRAYDTYDSVSRVGAVSDAGLCLDCDGTRRRSECSCSEYVETRKRTKAVPRLDVRSAEAEESLSAPRPRKRIRVTEEELVGAALLDHDRENDRRDVAEEYASMIG